MVDERSTGWLTLFAMELKVWEFLVVRGNPMVGIEATLGNYSGLCVALLSHRYPRLLICG